MNDTTAHELFLLVVGILIIVQIVKALLSAWRFMKSLSVSGKINKLIVIHLSDDGLGTQGGFVVPRKQNYKRPGIVGYAFWSAIFPRKSNDPDHYLNLVTWARNDGHHFVEIWKPEGLTKIATVLVTFEHTPHGIRFTSDTIDDFWRIFQEHLGVQRNDKTD